MYLVEISKASYNETFKASEQTNDKAKDLILIAGVLLGFNLFSLTTMAKSPFHVVALAYFSISVFAALMVMKPLRMELVTAISDLHKKTEGLDIKEVLYSINEDFVKAVYFNLRKLVRRNRLIKISLFFLGVGLFFIILANIDIFTEGLLWQMTRKLIPIG